MSKYYIICKDKNSDSYSIIQIGNNTKLESIDKYTMYFNDKKRLIENINSNGHNISPDSDVFIAYKNGNSVSFKDILYRGITSIEMRENIDISLKDKGAKLETYDMFKRCFDSYKYRTSIVRQLLNSGLYPVYKELKDALKNSKTFKDFNSNIKYWLRTNYNNIRDLAVLLHDSQKLDHVIINDFIKEKKELNKDRKIIEKDLKTSLDSFGQLSMIDGPKKEYIHITNVLPRNFPKKRIVSKDNHEGEIKPNIIDNIEVVDSPNMGLSLGEKEYKLDILSIRRINAFRFDRNMKKLAKDRIINFLLDSDYMPNDSIIEENGKYRINFDCFGYDYSEEDKGVISSLLSQNMMGLLFEYKNYDKQLSNEHLSSYSYDVIKEDQKICRNEIRRYLDKYGDVNRRSFDGIFRFCQIQKEVVDGVRESKGRKVR